MDTFIVHLSCEQTIVSQGVPVWHHELACRKSWRRVRLDYGSRMADALYYLRRFDICNIWAFINLVLKPNTVTLFVVYVSAYTQLNQFINITLVVQSQAYKLIMKQIRANLNATKCLSAVKTSQTDAWLIYNTSIAKVHIKEIVAYIVFIKLLITTKIGTTWKPYSIASIRRVLRCTWLAYTSYTWPAHTWLVSTSYEKKIFWYYAISSRLFSLINIKVNSLDDRVLSEHLQTLYR